MQRTDWVIYGAGISALVLAERLGSAGNRVMLISPSKSWGGIFGGIHINGDIYDVGMTNFEFDLFGEPSNDIQNYHPDRKPDVGRYVHFAKDYLARFVETVPLATPRMQFGSQVVDDLIISNHFDILAVLPPEVRMAIRKELEGILAAPNLLHPRTKSELHSPLATKSLESASLANHGPTFHGLLIEPMFRKVLGISSAEIAGVFHRNGWVPLFYPESLLSQFGPSPQSLQPTLFHYPKDVNFGGFIERIADVVRRLPNVKIVYNAKDIEIDLIGSTIQIGVEEFSFQRLAWGGDIGQLTNTFHKTLPPTKRADLDLFFLKVKDEGVINKFTVLLDPEEISPFYRVTNQSICAGATYPEHKIILECNSHRWGEDSPDKSRILDAALTRYGIDPKAIVSCHRRSFKGALAIPSIGQMTSFNRQRQYIEEEFPEVELIGASSGYVSVTLNDHIIQALKIARQEGVHI